MPNEERKGEAQREVATILDSIRELIREPAFSCSLVQLLSGGIVNRARGDADFRTALRFVADYAGIPLPSHDGGTDYRKEIDRKRKEREQIDRSADRLADMERSLRLECRNKIHECDRILTKPGPWDAAQWQRAKWAQVLQRDFLLPEYTLVAFGSMAERVRYVLANDGERASICGAIGMSGGTRTDSGHFMELMQ